MERNSRPDRALATAFAVLALTLGLVNLAAVVVTSRTELLLSPDAWLPLSASAVGWLIAHHVPRNPVGWLLLTMGLSSALFGSSALLVATSVGGPVVATAAWLSTWVWLPSYLLALWFLPMLFPDGQPVSARWRPVILGSVVLFVVESGLLAFGSAESVDPEVANPLFLAPVGALLVAAEPVIFLSMAVMVILGVLSLLHRFVRARGESRVQILAVLVAAVTGVVYFLLVQSGLLFALLVPVAIAVSVLRFRLYGVERLLAKTIVYGGLAAAAALVYVIGLLAATHILRADDDLRLQALVIVVAVLVIHPLRDRLMRLANRLVYGRRSDPYESLAALAHRVGAAVSPDDTLPAMASAMAEALSAESVTVTAVVDDKVVSVGTTRTSAPDEAAERSLEQADTRPPIVKVMDVRHHGQLVGILELARREPLTSREQEQLDVLLAQAGPALRTLGLTAMLRAELDKAVRTAADLRESRARLVTAHDTARRRIERDLHDGAQQGLLAIAVEIGRIQRRVEEAPTEAGARLAALQDLARRTLVDLRTLAAGTYPPVLRELGVAAALRERAEGLPVAVHVEDRLSGRPEAALESALYFGCLEAMTNAVKHARASKVCIELLEPSSGCLGFRVSDDGVGFDTSAPTTGTGLEGIADRLGVFAGGVTVESTQGSGTTVRAWAYDADELRYNSTA